MKHTKKRAFVIVYLDLVDHGLSYEEAAIVRYVERFERSKKPCFASIPYMAKDLRLSERTIRRCIRRLLQLEFLIETGKGRGRYLNTIAAKMAALNPAKMAGDSGQSVTDCGQIGRSDCGQNGRLSNSNLINNKININLTSVSSVSNSDGEDMQKKSESELEREAILRKAWHDPEGWQDEGSVMTKWHEETRTMLRKNKPTYQDRCWNGKTEHSDIPE
jgi:hypothetical protein